MQDGTRNLIGSAIMKVVFKPIKFHLTSGFPRHYEKGLHVPNVVKAIFQLDQCARTHIISNHFT